MQLIFDGHNDVLLRLWEHEKKGADPIAEFVDGTTEGHIDAPRAKKGGLAGGFCAIFIPPKEGYPSRVVDENGHYSIPMVGPAEHAYALQTALEMADIASRLEKAGGLAICRTTADIRAAMDAGRFAAILHIEGCEPIAEDLTNLEAFYAAGLR